ncbi:MAG: glycoside hydrolase family 32 protein [Lachnospiraceae bacterium]|nr:glycoside hydrolase family 32 protein [Lachnospiraceae bacterium]
MNIELLKKQISAAEEAALEKTEQDHHRQGYHLMPLSGWMNDPNGLCYFKGEYHVYFQHSPLDANRGSIFWGHYSSPDMLNWTLHPNFLYPVDSWDCNGVYSGSALVEDDRLYLYYTGNVKHPGNYDYIYEGRGHNVGLAVTTEGIEPDTNQCILMNKDYPEGLSCHVRDPKVWKLDGKYYMVLGARTREDVGELLIFESEDKYTWKHINVIRTPEKMGYMWECPDIFCVDGQWIVMTSPQGMESSDYIGQNVYSCGYFPLYGDFRGEYTLGEYCEADAGFDYYAPQSFEAPDGRRLVIGWMGMPDAEYTNPTAENLWQHCMSIPRQLTWEKGQLYTRPAKEMKKLRKHTYTFACETELALTEDRCSETEFYNSGSALCIKVGDSAEIRWEEGLLRLSISETAGCGRTERFLRLPELTKVQMFVDASSIELFFNEGQHVMTTRFYPTETPVITIKGTGTGVHYQLASMNFGWNKH